MVVWIRLCRWTDGSGPFFLVVENDWLYGSGLADMKGGLAALIAAAAAVMNARE
jgi:acetylornithine deacetylase/succinyl-diaminopimelate desuccinylase-like protein